ncbi:MAG: type II secretion system protein, partial [Lentisphaeria bacterium]
MLNMFKKIKKYTLVELLIASTALIVVLSALMPLMVFVVRSVAKAQTMYELETKAMLAQEWLKRDLRRTSRSEILMYPSASYTVEDEDITYTGNAMCISFPILNRGDDETSLPLNADGEIEWNQTIVYHVSYNGDTSKRELRRTVFDPRDNTLTSSERLLQLVYTWWDGDGSLSPYNSENATTQTLATNVSQYLITSGIPTIDAYNSSQDRQIYPVGTWILEPGSQTFRFDSQGKNQNSTGYDIGLDEIRASATGVPYDVECLLPASRYSGSAPVAVSMNDYAGWRNNAQMLFPASDETGYIEFEIYNDMWLESTFNFDDATPQNVQLTFDGTIGEKVCRMDGNDTSWEASIQTIGGTPEAPGNNYGNSTFRTIIGGADTGIGGNIAYSGATGKVILRAAPTGGDLGIDSAYIMVRDSAYNGSGTPVQLTFADATGTVGATSVTIPQGTTVTSDAFDLPISPDNDYLVSFHIADDPSNEVGRPAIWDDTSTSETHTYHIPHASGDTTDESGTADWSAYSASVSELNKVIAVDSLVVSYPATATYTSRVMDTHMANPQFESVKWRESLPAGTDIKIRVRSGDASDMARPDRPAAGASCGPGHQRHPGF